MGKGQKMDDTDWGTRATAWEMAAFSLRYPDTTLIEALTTGEWQEAAEEILQALKVEDMPSLDTSEYRGMDPDHALHTLRAEATRLFIGSPDPVTSPYEGVWRAQADGVQPLLFVNPHSMDVERFMRDCGLGRPEGTNEPLDHIATEAEFLSYLAGVSAGIIEVPEGISQDDFRGGSAEASYEAFLEEHIHTWVLDFIQAVEEHARVDYFVCAVRYLSALVGKQASSEK